MNLLIPEELFIRGEFQDLNFAFQPILQIPSSYSQFSALILVMDSSISRLNLVSSTTYQWLSLSQLLMIFRCIVSATRSPTLSLFARPELQDPDLCEVFGFPIRASSVLNAYDEYYPKAIPSNYRYERTGVEGGVLAPIGAFDGGPPVVLNQTSNDLRGQIARAERALVAGYPAKTILIARQFRASFQGLGNFERGDLPHLMTLWAEAALLLDRPSHAAVVLALRDDPGFNMSIGLIRPE